MLTELFNNPLGFLFGLIALVVAITIHEYAHAYAAERLGDPTPRLMGRLTLNPLAHLDPLGTLMLLIARFGWGKPVQFDAFNLRNPRRDSAIISIAGPASNIILAIICSVILQILFNFRFPLISQPFIGLPALPAGGLDYWIIGLLQPIIILNVILAIFNLVPIHPLDGFKIVEGILPEEYARQWKELEPYGMIFLIVMIFPIFSSVSPIHTLISPIINVILSILLPNSPLI